MAARQAYISAVSVEIQCPHCFDSQPNFVDGSFIWTPEMVRNNSGLGFECNNCDGIFELKFLNKVDFND